MPTRRPAQGTERGACLVHIYPTGPGLGCRFDLGDSPVIMGRADECAICVPDQSVSRRHARIQPANGGYAVIDLRSTNGTLVNDQPVSVHALQDGDYLRIGNCIYRFLAGGNIEREYYEEIYRLTIIDALTGAYNRRYLLEFLDREVSRSVRHRRPLALVLFDIDLFKNINDDLGHLAGDYTLCELSARVRAALRKEEVLARYGGEEFALGLVETTFDGAAAMAERVRALVEGHAFTYEGHTYSLTISLGIATTSGEESLTPTELIRRADARLHRAKRKGRNCVVG
jgi:diguanylate cyclase (GGDEF)-like protein